VYAVATPRHGGTLPYTIAMIEALAANKPAGVELFVCTPTSGHEFEQLGVEVVRASGWRHLLQILTQRSPLQQADLVIAPVYSVLLALLRLPFIFTLHDMQERYYPQHFSVQVRAWRRLSNFVLVRRARTILCESRFVQKDIIRFLGAPPERVAVIPAPPARATAGLTVDVSEIASIKAAHRLDQPYLFYPAQFWPHKNHLRLVEAFAIIAAQIPDCLLVLTGQERNEFQKVRVKIEQLGLGGRVRHVGHVTQRELCALYGGAAVTVIPTLFESISIPAYEAFAIGSPLCISDVVALPEQVGDAAILFDPKDPTDIAEKVLRIMRNPGLGGELVARGKARMATLTQQAYGGRLWQCILDRH
jgi:glycosyltransferase involved in cell wall biosynthesis